MKTNGRQERKLAEMVGLDPFDKMNSAAPMHGNNAAIWKWRRCVIEKYRTKYHGQSDCACRLPNPMRIWSGLGKGGHQSAKAQLPDPRRKQVKGCLRVMGNAV